MKTTLITLAILLAFSAQAFAQSNVSDGLEYSAKQIRSTNEKTVKRDEICTIAGSVARAAWTYKEEKAVFPFELMNANSPFFPLYLWAYQYGTHKAPNRAEATAGGLTMCTFNAHEVHRAWEEGRPLGAADLKCPDIFPSCK